MKFEERRPVRSAFAGTAGGFVAAPITRPDATPTATDTRTSPAPTLASDAITQPERR